VNQNASYRPAGLSMLFAASLAAILVGCGGSDSHADPTTAPQIAATANGEVKAVDRAALGRAGAGS
jgi:hypothetical protein